MKNKQLVTDGVKANIESRIDDYYTRFERYLQQEGMEGGVAMYADALGRSFYYLGDEEKARAFFLDAYRHCQVHLDRYREAFLNNIVESAGTWREPKPTELVDEIMRCVRPAWWIGNERARDLLQEVLMLCEAGAGHRVKGTQLTSLFYGYYALLLLDQPEGALGWLHKSRAWLADHPEYPFEDSGDILGILEESAQALVVDDETMLRQAFDHLERFMENNKYLLFGINPANEIFVYEVLRRKLAGEGILLK